MTVQRNAEEIDLTPRPEHRFTFGLWTVGNPGRDPFGEPTRPPLDPVTSVERLAELGAYGVSLHDNDLVPYGSSAAERDQIVARFSDALQRTGMRRDDGHHQPVHTPRLQGRCVHLERSRRAACRDRQSDAGHRPRRRARAPSLRLLGRARGRRERGQQATSADALERYREAINFLSALRPRAGLRPALRDRAEAQRAARRHLPADRRARAALHHDARPSGDGRRQPGGRTRDDGRTAASVHGVSQALWAGKLFHIDLNGQRIGRFDQDYRFGAEDLKEAFLLVHLLETSGYDGVRHFDAHAYRSEDADGVWDFAAGCMRTYLALAAKSRQFLASDAIREAREAARVDELAEPSVGAYSREAAAALLSEDHDLDRLAGHGYGVERLDQLVVELLLGAGG